MKRFIPLAFTALVIAVVSFGWVDVANASATMDFGSLGGLSMAALALGGVTAAPFPIQPELTAIAIAYRNKKLIADDVLPRVGVGKQDFKYLLHNLDEGFTPVDTKVGRKSAPNEVEFSATEKTDSTEDFGLDDLIPQVDIDNKPVNYDPIGRAVEGITSLVMLGREIRAAGLIFNPNSYIAANVQTLAGGSQFSDFANSDPIGVITDALDSLIMRPNVMTIGRQAYSKLARHPDILKAMHGNAGDKGIANRQAIADLFELEEIVVGEGFLNTAKKGQALSMARVWGKHISLTLRDKNANTNGGAATFGLTAQFGDRIAGSQFDGDIGLRGGQRVRSGESVKELITAPDLGYFLQNVVA